MYDLELKFYKITKKTDVNSLKNVSYGLIRIAQSLIDISEEAVVVEIRLPEILSDENKNYIKYTVQLFGAESIINDVNNYILFIDDSNMYGYIGDDRINRILFINMCGLQFIADKDILIAIYQNELGKKISCDILSK